MAPRNVYYTLRTSLGMTQQEMAKLLGVHRMQVTQAESGTRPLTADAGNRFTRLAHHLQSIRKEPVRPDASAEKQEREALVRLLEQQLAILVPQRAVLQAQLDDADQRYAQARELLLRLQEAPIAREAAFRHVDKALWKVPERGLKSILRLHAPEKRLRLRLRIAALSGTIAEAEQLLVELRPGKKAHQAKAPRKAGTNRALRN